MSTSWRGSCMRSAFTLMELLVVITIISVLTAMLLPAVKMVRTAAQKAVCGTHLRQVGMGSQAYANDWEGMVPTRYDLTVNPRLTWQELIAPYVEAATTATGIVDIQKARSSVISGCPGYRATPLTTYGRLGYAMNGYLACGEPGHTYDNNRLDPPATWGNDGPVVNFYMGKLSYPTKRLLLGDGFDFGSFSSNIVPFGLPFSRHGGVFNGLFCDLHLEPISTNAQFAAATVTPQN